MWTSVAMWKRCQECMCIYKKGHTVHNKKVSYTQLVNLARKFIGFVGSIIQTYRISKIKVFQH